MPTIEDHDAIRLGNYGVSNIAKIIDDNGFAGPIHLPLRHDVADGCVVARMVTVNVNVSFDAISMSVCIAANK